MARQDTIDDDDKVRLLRALAFQIHRKRPAEEALLELLEHESKGGRRRAFRAGIDALAAEGFTAAMAELGMFGEDALVLLAVLVDSGDHRLLSGALGKIADLLESKSP
jgi:HEAT repeat protein